MYCAYASEMKVKAELDGLGIEAYIPMKYALVEHGIERRRELVPAIHNLIFVHESRERITELKMYNSVCTHLQYMMSTTLDGARRFLIIPDASMKNFMLVTSQYSDQIVYLRYDDYLNKPGSHVRIIDGIFAGVEGVIKRIKKDRVVVVLLKGVAAVAITEITFDHLQYLD